MTLKSTIEREREREREREIIHNTKVETGTHNVQLYLHMPDSFFLSSYILVLFWGQLFGLGRLSFLFIFYHHFVIVLVYLFVFLLT